MKARTFAQTAILNRIEKKKRLSKSFQDHWVDYEEYYNDYDDMSHYYDVDTY